MDLNFGKWLNNFESSGTLLSKVVELWQLWQLYNFAKLRKLPKVEVDVFLMSAVVATGLSFCNQLYPNRPTTVLKSGNMHLAWDLMQNPACHDRFTKRLMQSKNECGLWRNTSPWDDVLTRQVTQKSRQRLKLSYIMPINFKCEKVAGKCDGDSTLNHSNVKTVHTACHLLLIPRHPTRVSIHNRFLNISSLAIVVTYFLPRFLSRETHHIGTRLINVDSPVWISEKRRAIISG